MYDFLRGRRKPKLAQSLILLCFVVIMDFGILTNAESISKDEGDTTKDKQTVEEDSHFVEEYTSADLALSELPISGVSKTLSDILKESTVEYHSGVMVSTPNIAQSGISEVNPEDVNIIEESSNATEESVSEEDVDDFESVADTIGVSNDERTLIYYIVQAETNGSTIAEHKKMVTCVIINRVLSDKFEQNTVTGIIYAKNQFSSLYNAKYHTLEPDELTIESVDYVLDEMTVEEANEWSSNSMYFYNPDVCGYVSWFEKKKFIVNYDGNKFFRD